MQYARFPVGKSRKNRVTDKESEGFAYLCTNLNDWGMSDIFNSSHFLRALMKSYQASQENQGAAEISWGSIAHCKSLDFTFLPFTFLPFEGTEQSAGVIQRRRVHRPPMMDWVHPAIRDRVDFL